MNKASITINWDKTSGQLQIVPSNLTENEVTAVLRAAITVCDQHTFEAAKKSGLVIPSGPFPSVGGS